MLALLRAMADASVKLRIRVIVVSTRAALRSLAPGDPQAPRVVERGRGLLAALESETSDGSDAATQAFEEARSRIDEMVEDRA